MFKPGAIIECIMDCSPWLVYPNVKWVPAMRQTYMVRDCFMCPKHGQPVVLLEGYIVGYFTSTKEEVAIGCEHFKELLPGFDLEAAINKVEELV